jgi:hypothetical protein
VKDRCSCTYKGGRASKRQAYQHADEQIEIEKQFELLCFRQDKLADVAWQCSKDSVSRQRCADRQMVSMARN